MRGWTLAVLVGCSGGADEPLAGARAFVASDGAVFSAVVGDAERATAYRCDGDERSATHSEWFSGGVEDDGSFVLGGSAGDAIVTFGDGEATLSFPDAEVTAVEVDAASDAEGLFRAEGESEHGPIIAGWILAPDGEQRGAIGLSTSGTLFGVSPLGDQRGALELTVDGAAVTVDVFNVASGFGE